MGTSKESILTLKAGTIPSPWEDGEENLLAGAAKPAPQPFPQPPVLPPRRLLAVCRSPRPRPSGAGCQHQTTAVKAKASGVGPLALALTAVVDLAYPHRRERLPRWGAKVST